MFNMVGHQRPIAITTVAEKCCSGNMGYIAKENGAVTVQRQQRTAHGWTYTTIVTKLEENQHTASHNLLKSI